MFYIKFDGIRVFYAGDYSMEKDRHFIQAEVPNSKHKDKLILSDNKNLLNSEDREKLFTEAIQKIVTLGGYCLIPYLHLDVHKNYYLY